MTNANTSVRFTISRSLESDNKLLGGDRWDVFEHAKYEDLLRHELGRFMDTGRLTISNFEQFNQDYQLDAELTFDAEPHLPVKQLVSYFRSLLSENLSTSIHFDVTAFAINGFTLNSHYLLNSRREPSLGDLTSLTSEINHTSSTLTNWFEHLILDKDAQADTLQPVIDRQIASFEEALAYADQTPFKGTGGNKTPEERRAAVFLNKGANDATIGQLIRQHVLEGDVAPETIIAELKATRDATRALTSSFSGTSPRLSPLDEIFSLADKFGPAVDNGSALITPEYIDRNLKDFDFNSVAGKMMRYGMFLASQLALEIREGCGGTQNIRDLHVKLASEFGANITQKTIDNDELYGDSRPGF